MRNYTSYAQYVKPFLFLFFWEVFRRQMNFRDLLVKWNNGINRGAQLRFSKEIGVDQVNVGRWVSGKTLPKEEIRPKLAKMLGVTVDELMLSFKDEPPAMVKETPPTYGADPLLKKLDEISKQLADVQGRLIHLENTREKSLDELLNTVIPGELDPKAPVRYLKRKTPKEKD